MDVLVTTDELIEYLGVDDDKKTEVESMRKTAIETVYHATGYDYRNSTELNTYNEALRVRVWISYYAVRDSSENTGFLQDCYIGLIGQLRARSSSNDT